MSANTGFIAYPGFPQDLAAEITRACTVLSEYHGTPGFLTWEENDIAGRFLTTPILENIQNSSLFVADITKIIFNVAFEIGYAIGCNKRVALVMRSDMVSDKQIHSSLGIFDTLGYKTYSNAESLAAIIKTTLSDVKPIPLSPRNSGRPRLFLIEPPQKASYDISLLSAIKKSGISFERYDPSEHGRLPARYAIEFTSKEDSFVARFLPNNRQDALIHNTRVAFCAGLSQALDRDFLLFQESEDPVPLDYRDLVRWVPDPNDIGQRVGELALKLYAKQEFATKNTSPTTLLSQLSLGSSIAENESRKLSDYYLKTEHFKQAERGEVQIVTGRKGAGKTAFFIELRNSLRRNPNNIILDLQPEGFQLIKFKERCLKLLSDGSKEHLLTALWEYVILLEAAFRILRDERVSHVHNHKLNGPYRTIDAFVSKHLASTKLSEEGDFSERLDRVLYHVEQKLIASTGENESTRVLSNPNVTEVLYSVDLREMQKLIEDYISHKAGLWVFVDNLDKGWPAIGVTEDDTRIIRCLQSALRKIEKGMQRRTVNCCGTVFIRSDVYEHLVASTPDKGKIRKVSLDLSNKEILKEVLRRRIAHSLQKDNSSLEDIWPSLFVPNIGKTAEQSSSFLLNRSLMRPRGLLDVVQACVSNAVTLGHEKVTEADIKEGLGSYSVELAKNIGFEIRDVYHTGEDIIYSLIGSHRRLGKSKLVNLLDQYGVANKDEFIDLLLWYGVLGLVDLNGDAKYIYDERYEIQKLKAVQHTLSSGSDPTFEINPAFWAALDLDDV